MLKFWALPVCVNVKFDDKDGGLYWSTYDSLAQLKILNETYSSHRTQEPELIPNRTQPVLKYRPRSFCRLSLMGVQYGVTLYDTNTSESNSNVLSISSIVSYLTVEASWEMSSLIVIYSDSTAFLLYPHDFLSIVKQFSHLWFSTCPAT